MFTSLIEIKGRVKGSYASVNKQIRVDFFSCSFASLELGLTEWYLM